MDDSQSIEVTKKEFHLLVDLIKIADWVLHSHRTEVSQKTKSYQHIVQKIYSQARQMGLDHLIQYDENLKVYFPSKEYEEKALDKGFIQEYDDDSFWSMLVSRMVERDLISLKEDEKKDKLESIAVLESIYAKEFESNGIDRVVIDHRRL